MKFKRKFIALAAVLTALPFTILPVHAENDFLEDDEVMLTDEVDEESFITSGDYKYSLQGENAVLEEYLGNDTEVEIPMEIDGYTVTGLGNQTFYLNDKITKIFIPATLEDFGYTPFYGCTSLMEFTVDEENELYTSDSDGALVGKQGEAIMAYPIGRKPEKYVVPDSVIIISDSAFAMCSSLKEITLPDGLIYLGAAAFSECTALESIELPDTLEKIYPRCFTACTSLKEVKLPQYLQSIDNAAFFECKSLKEIDFPSSLSEIGQGAFCSTGMTYIEISPSVLSIGTAAFGFHTDENYQFVADDDFLIMGYSTSYAKTYAQENDIEFKALDEPETETNSQSDENEEPSSSRFVVSVIIFIIWMAIIIGIITLIAKKINNKNSNGNANDAEDEK